MRITNDASNVMEDKTKEVEKFCILVADLNKFFHPKGWNWK
jgi:hypothetical protein